MPTYRSSVALNCFFKIQLVYLHISYVNSGFSSVTKNLLHLRFSLYRIGIEDIALGTTIVYGSNPFTYNWTV